MRNNERDSRFVLDNTLHLVPQLHDDEEGCTEVGMEGSPVVCHWETPSVPQCGVEEYMHVIKRL